jgi:hypothetical protein
MYLGESVTQSGSLDQYHRRHERRQLNSFDAIEVPGMARYYYRQINNIHGSLGPATSNAAVHP